MSMSSMAKIENLLLELWNIPDVKYEIHTAEKLIRQNSEIFHFNHKLLLLESNSLVTFRILHPASKLGLMSKSQLIAIILSSEDSVTDDYRVFEYSNTIVLQNGSAFDFHMKKEIFSIEHFVANDFFNLPEEFWPNLDIQFSKIKHEGFPLIINFKESTSGIFSFLGYAFIDYMRTKIQQKFGFQETSDRKKVTIYVSSKVMDNLALGYPFLREHICFMLPLQNEISTQDFLRKPFTKIVWLFILLFVLYLMLMLRLSVHTETFVSFMESLTITFGSSYKGQQNASMFKSIIYIQLFAYGFVTSNLYMSKLSSFLTTLLGKTIDTLEDLKEKNISVLAPFEPFFNGNKEYFGKIFPEVYDYWKKLGGQFHFTTPEEEFDRNLIEFNTSYGYLIPEHRWSFISRSQSFLKRKLFSFSELCTNSGFVYPLRSQNPYLKFHDIFTYFYMRVSESGLKNIWETLSYRDMNFHYIRLAHEQWIVLGFEYFQVAWWILAIGVSLSLCVFLIEISRNKSIS